MIDVSRFYLNDNNNNNKKDRNTNEITTKKQGA